MVLQLASEVQRQCAQEEGRLCELFKANQYNAISIERQLSMFSYICMCMHVRIPVCVCAYMCVHVYKCVAMYLALMRLE